MMCPEVENILKSCHVSHEQPVLVALSGGADSMTLLHVLKELGFPVQAAHCNFHLRDKESDGDEQFIFDYCLENDIPLHVKHFNTAFEAQKQGISIEMAARQLRYAWFWELMEKEKLSWLATGHHGDDMIETFFLNLARGTGSRGLKGMQYRNGQLLRPLLSFNRHQIDNYCHQNGIPFRTDSTNYDAVYKRNNIRHNVIPVMNLLNPSFFDTMMDNFRNINEVWQIFEKEVESVKEKIVAREEDNVLIPVKLMKEHPQRTSVLFEILRPYNFNSDVVAEIIKSLDGIPGKQFFSKTHRIVRDRFNLILVPLDVTKDEVFYLESEDDEINQPFSLKIRIFEKDSDFRFSRDSRCVHLDADLVEFPLELRHWRKGDQFRPLGMEQFKKLSDFFVDEKLSLVEKEQTWLLLSGNDIVWVVGCRIDDRYKVTQSTRNIMELKL